MEIIKTSKVETYSWLKLARKSCKELLQEVEYNIHRTDNMKIFEINFSTSKPSNAYGVVGCGYANRYSPSKADRTELLNIMANQLKRRIDKIENLMSKLVKEQ